MHSSYGRIRQPVSINGQDSGHVPSIALLEQAPASTIEENLTSGYDDYRRGRHLCGGSNASSLYATIQTSFDNVAFDPGDWPDTGYNVPVGPEHPVGTRVFDPPMSFHANPWTKLPSGNDIYGSQNTPALGYDFNVYDSSVGMGSIQGLANAPEFGQSLIPPYDP